MKKLSGGDKALAEKLRQSIVQNDNAVDEKTGAIMSAKDALCYHQDGVMKYGLAQTKSGFTVHSMVMYANPDIADFAKTRLRGAKLQKGCFNISSLADFDFEAFDEFMRLSARKDFSPVIAHYKRKQKKGGL